MLTHKSQLPFSNIRPILIFHSSVFLVFVLGVLVYLNIWDKANFRFLWYLIYGVSIIYIINKIRKGLFFEPIVIFPSSYMFFNVFGSLFFEEIRGRGYNAYIPNLVGIGYLALVVGVILSQNYGFRFKSAKLQRVMLQQHAIRSEALVYLLIIVSLLATFSLFVKFGGLPILAAGNVNEAKLALVAGSGYLNIFFMGLPLLSLAVLYDACITRDKKKMTRSHILAAILMLAMFTTGYRGKTLMVIAQYALLYYFFNRRTFSLRLMLTVALAFLIFVSSVGAYRRGDFNVSSALVEMGIIFTTRLVIFELITQRFDASNYFGASRYFYDLQKLLPGVQTRANVDLKYDLFRNAENMPDLGGITPSILGETYMNFGPTGIPWVMLLFGASAGFAYRFMTQNPSFIRCAVYLVLVRYMAVASSCGIGPILPPLVMLGGWVVIIGVLYEKRFTLSSSRVAWGEV